MNDPVSDPDPDQDPEPDPDPDPDPYPYLDPVIDSGSNSLLLCDTLYTICMTICIP